MNEIRDGELSDFIYQTLVADGVESFREIIQVLLSKRIGYFRELRSYVPGLSKPPSYVDPVGLKANWSRYKCLKSGWTNTGYKNLRIIIRILI